VAVETEVAMQRDGVDLVVALLEHDAIPLEVRGHAGAARSAGDELKAAVNRAHLSRRVHGLPSVLLRRHVADLPVAVHLVAEAEALDAPGRLDAVRSPEIAPLRS